MEAKESQRLHAEADRLIRGMYLGQVGWAARERARELKLHAVFATVRGDPGASAALHRLLYGLAGGGHLVALPPGLGGPGPPPGETGRGAAPPLPTLPPPLVPA